MSMNIEKIVIKITARDTDSYRSQSFFLFALYRLSARL